MSPITAFRTSVFGCNDTKLDVTLSILRPSISTHDRRFLLRWIFFPKNCFCLYIMYSDYIRVNFVCCTRFPIITHLYYPRPVHWGSIPSVLHTFYPLFSHSISRVHTASLLRLHFPPHLLSKGSAAPWGGWKYRLSRPLVPPLPWPWAGDDPCWASLGFFRCTPFHLDSHMLLHRDSWVRETPSTTES